MIERPKHSQEVAEMMQAGKDLAGWIATKQHDVEIPGRRAAIIPALQYDQCIEHQVAIVSLLHDHVYGSAFALLRASTESLVRGVWLQDCATTVQLDAFADNDRLPRGLTFKTMVSACTEGDAFEDAWWLASLEAAWETMNSYTHSGTLQLGRRLRGREIQPNYKDEEVIEVLLTAGTSALVALRQIAVLARQPALIAEVNGRLAEGA